MAHALPGVRPVRSGAGRRMELTMEGRCEKWNLESPRQAVTASSAADWSAVGRRIRCAALAAAALHLTRKAWMPAADRARLDECPRVA